MAIVQNPPDNNDIKNLLKQLLADKQKTPVIDPANEIKKFYTDLNESVLSNQAQQLEKLREKYDKRLQKDIDKRNQLQEQLEQIKLDLSDESLQKLEKELRKQNPEITRDELDLYKNKYIIESNIAINDINAQIERLEKSINLKSKNLAKKEQQLIEDTNQQILELNAKKDHALEVAEKNRLLRLSVSERAQLIKDSIQQKEIRIQAFEDILAAEGTLTTEQQVEYNNLIKEKIKEDERYFQLRKAMIMENSKAERLARYKEKVKELSDEAKLQKKANRIENKDDAESIKKRDKEIDKQLKIDISSAQKLYDIKASDSKLSDVLSVMSQLEGGKGVASFLPQMSEIIGGVTGTAAAGSSAALGSAAGPIGVVIMILQGIAKIVGMINQRVAEGVEKAMSSQISYMAAINTRLQGIAQKDINYYDQMTEWQSDNDFGLAIGKWNAFVDKQKYIEQLNTLIQAGIAYNAEERALLQTISDKLVTTFDVMDTSLTRLIRLQQRDITYAAMGSESLLTQFLNRFAQMGGLPDTTYLSDVYDNVSAILLDAVSKLTSDQASAWSYEVQKWLGSLYSLGLSQEGVQQLAQGITYLQTGNVSELMQNQQLQYLYTAAAERAGLSIADILVQGIDINTTNILLSNVVTLLQDIYNNSSTNAVQSAWTTITGMSIADLRAMTNVSSDYLAYISSEHQDWASSWTEAEKQLNLATSSFRTSASEAITNIINNALLNVGQRITDETFASAGINTDWLNDNLQRYLNLASLILPINVGDTVEGVGNIGQAIVSTGKGLISSESGSSTIAGALNDLLGIGGMSKYTMYYLAQTIGGTVGNIVESMITIPEVINEIQDMMDWYHANNYSTLASVKKTLALDTRMFESTSTLSKVIDSLQNEMIIERTEGYSESTLFSDVKGLFSGLGSLWNTIIDKIESGIPSAGIDFNNAIDQFNTKLESLINNQNALTSISIDSQDSNIQAITSFAAQAEQTERTLATISNQSAEDRAIIEQADNIQSYLFENERLIRVSLSYIEPAAYQELNDTTLSDEKRELIEAILNIMRDKVPVDLIDNDVNTITRNLYNIKWS